MNFDDLPEELWALILSNLSTIEIIRIHTVSKSWLERCLKLHQNLDITQYSSIKDNQLAQILKRCDKNHMKNINLSGCRNLTDKTLETIKEFTNLNSLDLSFGYHLHEFEKLKSLVHIQKLSLSGCDEFNDLHLKTLTNHLKNITSLDLSGCLKISLRGIKCLREFENLKEFFFLKCLNITNSTLKYLSYNTKLESLKLGWCFLITDVGMSYLTRLTNLKDIHLHESREITDNSFNYISNLKKLKKIYVSDGLLLTDTSAYYLSQLPSVQDLYIGGIVHLTNTGVRHIAKMNTIKHLSLPGCYLKNDGLKIISEYATQLQSLSLSGCKELPQAIFLSAFQNWECNLVHLNLRGCYQLSDEVIKLICQSKTIESLNLGGCHQLTNASINYISTLPLLNSLNLSSCTKINDLGVTKLCDLNLLTFLDLSGCSNLTDQSIYDIALNENCCKNIKCIHLFGCRRVSNQCVENIMKLKKGLIIKIST